jgi:WD repeat-containing protein 70
MPDAHSPNCEVTDVIIFGQTFASRSLDDTMKLWDIRNTSQVVHEWSNLINLQTKTNMTLSPSKNIILTGTSVRKNYGQGMLHGFNVLTGERVCELPVGPASVVSTLWHPALNQIFLGLGDGKIQVFYDPKMSKGGILKCINKQEKNKLHDE